MRFDKRGSEIPQGRFRCACIETKKKLNKIYYSPLCARFSELRKQAAQCYRLLRDALIGLDEEQARRLSVSGDPQVDLDWTSKEWDAIERIDGCASFGGIQYSLQSWKEFIVGSVYGGDEACRQLTQIALSALRAGWAPLAWVGNFPDGYLLIFPIPGRSAPVPKEWLVSASEAKQLKPNLTKAIPRSSFPTPDLAPEPSDAWDTITALPPQRAVRMALTPVVAGGGKAGDEVVKKLSALALVVTRGGTKARPVLTLTLRAASGQSVTLSCQPPWTGSLEHLPTAAAQVLRHYNGMTLSSGAPKPQWLVYRGPAKGFDFAWTPWEVSDRQTDPSAWKTKPLAPFTNGQDLWIYHPARALGKVLELVKLDHESDTWEAEPQQHPGVRFLQMIHGCLAVV